MSGKALSAHGWSERFLQQQQPLEPAKVPPETHAPRRTHLRRVSQSTSRLAGSPPKYSVSVIFFYVSCETDFQDSAPPPFNRGKR